MSEKDERGTITADPLAPIECKICGLELEWTDCGACEDGFYDGYDEDPLWYDPGDMIRCPECGGQGGWLECPNAEHHQSVSMGLGKD